MIPRVRARLPRIFQRDHMIDLHRRRRFHSTYELDGLTGIRIVKRARRNLAATAVLILNVRQIAREHVFAHVATVAIVVGFAESERIAIISGLAGIVVDGKFFQRFRSCAGCRVLAGDFTYGRIDFRQQHADSDADYRNDYQQNKNTFQRTVGVDPTFFEPLAGPLDITHVAFNIPIIIRITIILSRHNY